MRDRLRAIAGLRRRASKEEGTVLVLVPAGLLVIILLGSMAFDLSLSFAGERRLADLAAAWANDAVAQIDESALYGVTSPPGGSFVLDQTAARASVLAAWDDLDEPGLEVTQVEVLFPDPLTVTVRVVGEVPLLFLDAVPGMGARRVDTVSTVSLVVAP